MGIVRNGCDQSGDEALKLTISEGWTDGITDFLHLETDSQKLKADQKFLSGHSQKLVWPVCNININMGNMILNCNIKLDWIRLCWAAPYPSLQCLFEHNQFTINMLASWLGNKVKLMYI